MASCNVCGRQVEVSDSGQTMPCVPECLNYNRRPFDSFLAYAAATCVGLPSLEVKPDGVCPKCGANAALEGYCEECEDYERDRKLAFDQDSDKDYRLGHNR
jgi:predicted nucleic acid-binding Zn ribbon protein